MLQFPATEATLAPAVLGYPSELLLSEAPMDFSWLRIGNEDLTTENGDLTIENCAVSIKMSLI